MVHLERFKGLKYQPLRRVIDSNGTPTLQNLEWYIFSGSNPWRATQSNARLLHVALCGEISPAAMESILTGAPVVEPLVNDLDGDVLALARPTNY